MRIGIKPRVDVVFKKVFASAEHSDITRDFLNSLLPLAGLPRIVRLTILNPFRLADFQGDKEIVVDVHAEDENRREFQIEMQLKRDAGLPSRVMDNLSRAVRLAGREGKTLWRAQADYRDLDFGASLFRGRELAARLSLSRRHERGNLERRAHSHHG